MPATWGYGAAGTEPGTMPALGYATDLPSGAVFYYETPSESIGIGEVFSGTQISVPAAKIRRTITIKDPIQVEKVAFIRIAKGVRRNLLQEGLEDES